MNKEILVIKHIGIEGPGRIEEFFRNSAWKLKIADLSAAEKLPLSLNDIEAVISLGGPMNVYEEEKYEFLKEEGIFLKKALSEGVPILGICLGAQLLAKACDSKIKKAEEKEVGWHKVKLSEDGRADTLFYGLPEEFEVFQWHEDTFELPKNASFLAEGAICKIQAFKANKNAYGIQFHFEVTPEMIASWAGVYEKIEAKRSLLKNMVIEGYRNIASYEKLSQLLCLNFSRVIENSRKVQV